MNEGWICPKCKKVYSPTTSECNSCNSMVAPYVYPYPIRTCTGYPTWTYTDSNGLTYSSDGVNISGTSQEEGT